MNEAEGLERVLNLFDLIMIGIASTVGTGVFVLVLSSQPNLMRCSYDRP